jgi:hypothetical protein
MQIISQQKHHAEIPQGKVARRARILPAARKNARGLPGKAGRPPAETCFLLVQLADADSADSADSIGAVFDCVSSNGGFVQACFFSLMICSFGESAAAGQDMETCRSLVLEKLGSGVRMLYGKRTGIFAVVGEHYSRIDEVFPEFRAAFGQLLECPYAAAREMI